LTPGGPPVGLAGQQLPVLEIGGTHVTAAIVDLGTGAVQAWSLQRATLNPLGPAADLLGAIIGCGGGLPVRGGERWGVAIPGPFDYQRGIALFADVGKFEALYGVDVRAALLNGLPGPAGSIIFLNDADAFLWGEWVFGAAAGHRRCVAITLGTGIGSAFIADGELRHEGPGVPPDGRVDLLQIGGLPLEDVVSARAIERSYEQATGEVPDSTAFVARRARLGDKTATAILWVSFEQLGQALRPWLEEFEANVLVVGGSMTGSWDLIGPALWHGLGSSRGDHASPPSFLTGLTTSVAARPEHAALLGAAAFAQRAETYDAGGNAASGRSSAAGRPQVTEWPG
jgi:glucokinase